jgi:tetratricopeptide (TPR) repeat protein
MFVQAGRGLAAAHAAGLVHRDFKPDNVLVGNDDTARVTDFGLARAVGEVAEGAAGPGPSRVALTAPATSTGQVLGTPVYMAPEQHLGRPADARADQFAFAVALHEALYGERPFAGDTYAELAHNVVDGARREPPARGVSRSIRRAIARGLAIDPADRHASMDALLATLERGARARRRRLIAAAAFVAVAAAGATLWIARDDQLAARCEGGGERLLGVWDPPRRVAANAAFLATGRAGAADAFARTAASLDQRATAIVDLHRQACLATDRGERSSATLDRAMECLDRRTGELRALTNILVAADRATVDRAVKAAHALVPVEVCADPTALLAEVPLPEEPARRAEVIAIRQGLAEVDALGNQVKYDAAQRLIVQLVEQARRTEHLATLAEALWTRGLLEALRGDQAAAKASFEQAIDAAARGRATRVEAQAWISLLNAINGLDLSAPEAALAARAAEAAVARAGDAPELRIGLLIAQSSLYYHAGKLDRSEETARAALAQMADHAPFDDKKSRTLYSLAITQRARGELNDALASLRQRLELDEHRLGPDHPQVGNTLAVMAELTRQLGHPADALTLAERGFAITERALGKDHPDLIEPLLLLGGIDTSLGNFDKAGVRYQRALAIAEHRLPPGDTTIGTILYVKGAQEINQKDWAAGIRDLERALTIYEAAKGKDHPFVHVPLMLLARGLTEAGQYDRALPYAQRAVAMAEKAASPAMLQEALQALARVDEKRGDKRGERAVLTRAIAAARKDKVEGEALAEDLTALADLEGCPQAVPPLEEARRIYGDASPHVAYVDLKLARCAVDAGDVAAAREHLDRAARAPGSHKDQDEAFLGERDFLLARVLWAEGRERPQAVELARHVREVYAKDPSLRRWELEVASWLAGHRVVGGK